MPKRHFDRTKARFTSALKNGSSSHANSETQAPSKCVSKRLAVGTVLEHCRRQQRDQGKLFIPLIYPFENVAENKEGLVGVPCGAETKLRVWYLMFSTKPKSPVRQQVSDHVCEKSIDTTIDSQQTIFFGGRSWTFFVQRRNFDFVPKMWGDTV